MKLIQKKSSDKLVIDCINNESVEKTLAANNTKLESTCSIEKEKYENPRMKLFGIDNYEDFNNASLKNDINSRNVENFNSKCKVLHSYKNPKNELQSLILEMPGDMHQFAKENYSKISVGYQSCKASDIINVNLCFKCGRYNHKGKDCNHEDSCQR